MSLRRALALVVVTASLVGAGASEARRRRSRAAVTWRTAGGTLYLDKGTRDGLAAGTSLRLYDGRRRVGRCTVDDASAHHATCTAKVERDVDHVRFRRQKRDKNVLPPPPARLDDAARARGQRALAAARFDKVDYDGPTFVERLRFPIETGLRHRSWAYTSFPQRQFHRERLSVALRGVGLGIAGLTAHARADLMGSLVAPDDSRFRTGERLRAEVFEVALSYRPKDLPVALAAGRFTPWNVVGIPMLDGVQAAFRWPDGGVDLVELGAYGGAIPGVVRLLPGTGPLTGGAYWALTAPLDGVHVRHLGRLGVHVGNGFSLRAEAEALVDVAWGRMLSAGAGARAALDVADPTRPWVDLAWAHATVRPLDGVTVRGGYRYGAPAPVQLALPNGAPPSLGIHHGDVSARWRALSFLRVGLLGGGSFDHRSQAGRAFAGPEVALPFGGTELSVSWQEEVGHLAGRMVTTTLRLTPLPRTRVYTSVAVYDNVMLGDAMREAAAWAWADAQLFDWLRLEGRLQAQGSLPSFTGHPRAVALGLSGELAVVGSL